MPERSICSKELTVSAPCWVCGRIFEIGVLNNHLKIHVEEGILSFFEYNNDRCSKEFNRIPYRWWGVVISAMIIGGSQSIVAKPYNAQAVLINKIRKPFDMAMIPVEVGDAIHIARRPKYPYGYSCIGSPLGYKATWL